MFKLCILEAGFINSALKDKYPPYSDLFKDFLDYKTRKWNVSSYRLYESEFPYSVNDFDGLIINAGGYTHTSVAIHDALKILKIPIIELHISNIYNREEFRHNSLISKVAKGVICGFGANGYIMSLKAMNDFLKNENW